MNIKEIMDIKEQKQKAVDASRIGFLASGAALVFALSAQSGSLLSVPFDHWRLVIYASTCFLFCFVRFAMKLAEMPSGQSLAQGSRLRTAAGNGSDAKAEQVKQ